MNKLYKALIYDKQVSLSVLETTELVNDAIKIHSLDGDAAKTFGCLLTAAAFMAGCLKRKRRCFDNRQGRRRMRYGKCFGR